MTNCAFTCRASFAPFSATAMVGSRKTEKTVLWTPTFSSEPVSHDTRLTSFPQTINPLFPYRLPISGIIDRLPSPKITRPAVANSNSMLNQYALSLGLIFANLTLWRGSAIILSTISRHCL